MKRTVPLLTALMFVLASVTAYPQSLADLAKAEKERREKIKATKVITNQDTLKYKNGPITTGTPAPSSPQKEADAKPASEAESGAKPATEVEASAGGTKATTDEPVDFKGRPESYWRQTMTDARQRVKELENEGNVLTLRMADLQNQFYREASGFKQQDIQREIQKTIFEQDRNKADLVKARDQLSDLEKEARKSGALPGWLTPKTP